MTRLKCLRVMALPVVRCRRYRGFQTLSFNCSPKSGSIPDSAWSYSFYKYFLRQQTLNCDRYPYGHANCATFQSYFETAVDHFAIKHCGLRSNQANSRVLGVTAETQGIFRRPLVFPQIILTGLSIKYLGTSSVQFLIGIFPEVDVEETEGATDNCLRSVSYEVLPCAVGYLAQVFVDLKTKRPCPIPDNARRVMEASVVTQNNPCQDTEATWIPKWIDR